MNHSSRSLPYHFTGLRLDQSLTRAVGHLLVGGLATFRSQRQKDIQYRVTLAIPPEEATNAAVLDERLKRATELMDRFTEAPARYGVLLNWGRRKARPVQGVEWVPWPVFLPEPCRPHSRWPLT